MAAARASTGASARACSSNCAMRAAVLSEGGSALAQMAWLEHAYLHLLLLAVVRRCPTHARRPLDAGGCSGRVTWVQ
eukprot:5164053-Pyramimonas_sp.AAC.1